MHKLSSNNRSIILLHGLGDTLLLFPVLYDFYLQNGNKKLDIIVAKQYGAKSFWDNITFVRKVYEMELNNHPRYWNPFLFFLKDYEEIIGKAKIISKKDDFAFIKITLLPLFVENFLSQFMDRHKISKTYKELNVSPIHKFHKFSIEEFFKKKDMKIFFSFLKKNKLRKYQYVVIHRKTYGLPKCINKSQIVSLAKEFPQEKFVVIMNTSMKNDEAINENGNINLQNVFYATNLEVTDLYFILKYAKCSIVIDSAMMHLSQFVNTPTIAIFKVRKVKPSLIVPFAQNIISSEVYNENDEYKAMKKFLLKYQH